MISCVSWELFNKAIEKAWYNLRKRKLNEEANNMSKIDINKKEDNFILATETIDGHKVIGLHKHEGIYYGGLTMNDGGELYFRWNGRGELIKGLGVSRLTDWNLKSPIMEKPQWHRETVGGNRVVLWGEFSTGMVGLITSKDGFPIKALWDKDGELVEIISGEHGLWYSRIELSLKPLKATVTPRAPIDLNKPIRFTEWGKAWVKDWRNLDLSLVSRMDVRINIPYKGSKSYQSLTFNKFGGVYGSLPWIENYKHGEGV